jgi:UDP-N-acetylmuramoyl-tripeptide--D-alanyl-D-alanine ligase
MKVSFVEEFFKVKLELKIESFSEVSTDTRTLLPGALFVALSGENFDGHKFVAQAFEKGAAAAIISNADFNQEGCITVDHVLKDFSKLAKAWQDKVAPAVIGITGSNGKTTAKFFTAQLLQGFTKVCYSPKSFNNEVGVPFTQAMLAEDDKVLISEIGTNHKGEIEKLTKQVEPELCVVTTVGPSHLEGFGTIENVAIEKRDIYSSKNIKTGMFNLDNPFTKKMHDNFVGEKITFSTKDKSADVFLQGEQIGLTKLSIKGSIKDISVDTTCAVFGEHHIYNIMVAVCSALYLKIDPSEIVDDLNVFSTPWGRSQVMTREDGGTVLFDAYNSNLQSMEALIASLKPFQKKGEQFQLIIGEMLELGENTKEMHKELGQKIANLDPAFVTFVGSSHESFSEGLGSWKNIKNSIITSTYDDSLAIEVQSVLDPSATVVLKGSRGARLERFFDVLAV